MEIFHKPVLLQEVCHYLAVKPQGRYIDATLGGGGHTQEIIKGQGLVLGLDQDPDALNACPHLDGLTPVLANFTHLREVAAAKSWTEVDGVLFDLGVSSHQFSTPGRGFSFQLDGPLDMRMDPTLNYTAADLVNTLSDRELEYMFKTYGEEPQSKQIARKIIQARPLTTTRGLAMVIQSDSQRRRVFQALRIAVNNELDSLEQALPQALSLLTSGGRIVVISFHSLEDRIVKNQFREWEKSDLGHILTPKPVLPGQDEINLNSKAKSAKLRAFLKK